MHELLLLQPGTFPMLRIPLDVEGVNLPLVEAELLPPPLALLLLLLSPELQ
jgi:hypothetical protein